jgi:hypothetical protein
VFCLASRFCSLLLDHKMPDEQVITQHYRVLF